MEKAHKLHKKIKQNIENSFKFFDENIKGHKKNMRFSFKETLTNADRRMLAIIEKPDLEVNYLQAYLSRFLGEFKGLSPSVAVRGNGSGDNVNVQLVELVQGHLQSIIDDFNKKDVNMDIFRELTGGGYSVLKVLTEYRKDRFEQDIYLGKADDPTTCFFDPMAKLLSKSDGRYCGEIYPMRKTEFKKKYPKYKDKIDSMSYLTIDPESAFTWSYRDNRRHMVLLVEYYCIESEYYNLLLLSDGSTMTQSEYNDYIKQYNELDAALRVEPPLEKVKSRKEKRDIVKRYVLFGEDVIEEEKTSLPGLPYIFVGAQNVFVYKSESSGEIQQVTRAYLEAAVDAQRLFNYICQTVANYAENYMNQKFIVDIEALVDKETWTSPQTASLLLKTSVNKDGQPIHEPVKEVVQQDLPPSIVGAFSQMQNVIQNVMGTYDAQMGINQKDLSGTALVASATQNNVIGVPFIGGFACALTAACELILKMLPRYYVTPMTIPYTNDEGEMSYIKINQGSPDSLAMKYKPEELDVEIKSSPSFAIQKDQALEQMARLSQAFPSFGEFINEAGVPFILDNLDIKGIDKLVQMSKEQQKEAQQQQQQPNPVQQEMQMRQTELQMKAQMQQTELQLKQEQLAIEREKLEVSKMESANQVFMEELKFKREIMNDAARYETHTIDNAAKIAEAKLKEAEQDHQHAMDIMNIKASKDA